MEKGEGSEMSSILVAIIAFVAGLLWTAMGLYASWIGHQRLSSICPPMEVTDSVLRMYLRTALGGPLNLIAVLAVIGKE